MFFHLAGPDYYPRTMQRKCKVDPLLLSQRASGIIDLPLSPDEAAVSSTTCLLLHYYRPDALADALIGRGGRTDLKHDARRLLTPSQDVLERGYDSLECDDPRLVTDYSKPTKA